MKNLIFKLSAMLLVGGFIFTSCTKDEDEVVPTPTPAITDIATTAVASGFDSLAVALTQTGLLPVFQGDNSGPYTVFAPTNTAFENLINSNSAWNSISDIDNALLSTVLQYHVLSGSVMSSMISDGRFVETLTGSTFRINTTGGVTIDVNATTTTGINVTSVDVEATNGVIHVIDQVLIPELPATAPTQSIAATAINAGFDSLVVALSQVGLVSTFDGSQAGTYTVFAPTNTAFENLINSNTAWNGISDIDNATLTAVLQLHVASGIVQAGQLSDGQLIGTLQGSDLTFNGTSTSLSGGSSMNVAISGTDVFATNGVVHIIDEVILP